MKPFAPPRWLSGAHAQTIVGKFIRRPQGLAFDRERWELPDGDFIDLDFVQPAGAATRSDAPVVLMLHGLEGSSRVGYAHWTYTELHRRGLRAVGFNFRGCSGEPNRLPRSYHSGDTADVRLVVQKLRQRFGSVPFGAVGFSLGGNVLLKHLGEEGDGALLDAAVAISVPFHLKPCAVALSQGFSRIYSWHLLGMLKTKLRERRDVLDAVCDVDRALRAKDFWTFDDASTAPMHGFDGADHYYETSSSAHYLAAIRRPTLLIQAKDDPFVPFETFDPSILDQNAQLSALISDAGGHVGFIGGSPWRPTFAAEAEAARYLAGVL